MQLAACSIHIRLVLLTFTVALSTVHCFTASYYDQWGTPTISNHSDFPEDFVFINATTVGIYRRVNGLIYTRHGVAAIHLEDRNLVIHNSSGSSIYKIRDFGPATLTFDDNQLSLWDSNKRVAQLVIPGWPRVNTSGRAEIVAHNATSVRSAICILGTPLYNGSHVVLTANDVITASYRSEGFPVITNQSVTILERSLNVSTQVISSSNARVLGQISQCVLRYIEVTRDLVTLLGDARSKCTAVSLPNDVVLQHMSHHNIMLRGADMDDLVRLDLQVTTIQHNRTHISLKTIEGVSVDSQTSGPVVIKNQNTVVCINRSQFMSVAGDLPLHSGIYHNGTHLTLGDAAIFFAPGLPLLRIGIAEIVTELGDVSATVELSAQIYIKEGFIHTNDTPGQAGTTFTAPGIFNVKKGGMTIQQHEVTTAKVLHNFTSVFYDGLLLHLQDGSSIVALAHAEGTAIFSAPTLKVVNDGNMTATIETSLLIEVSPANITFVAPNRELQVIIARQGTLLYNGTHLTDIDKNGGHRIIIGLRSPPHVNETGLYFGEQSNCSLEPCLTISTAGSFLYNSSTIRLENSNDTIILNVDASLITIADGSLRFVSHDQNKLLASALYATSPVVYLGRDYAELLSQQESCDSALKAGRNASRGVVVSLQGRQRVHNGSHIVVLDEQRPQTVVLEAPGDLTVDAVGQSCCITGGDSRRSVHLVFDFDRHTRLENGRIVMSAERASYNLSAPGLPIYNGSHVNIHDGSRYSASVAVSSFATLIEQSLLFETERGDTLLEVHLNNASLIRLSNGSLDIGGGGEESPLCRLKAGIVQAKFFPTHMDFYSRTNFERTRINYTAGFVRVTKNETVVISAKHNVTLEIQAVPHFSNGSLSLISDQVTFTASMPGGYMSCSLDKCTLVNSDSAVVMQIDTPAAFPVFSEKVLSLQASSGTEPFVIADIHGELFLNGTRISSPTTSYDFKVKISAVYNSTDVLLSTDEEQLPVGKIKDINSIHVTSAGAVFSGKQVRRLALPPLKTIRIRSDLIDSAGTLSSDEQACAEHGWITMLGLVDVNVSLPGRMILIPKNSLQMHGNCSHQSFHINGLDLFTFTEGTLSANAGETTVAVDCALVVPRFSSHGVDLLRPSGTNAFAIRAPLSVPNYNCSHIVLEEAEWGGQPLGFFDAHDASLHYKPFTGEIHLVGNKNKETLATIVQARSITVSRGIMTASSSDGDRVIAYLCAPGDAHYADGVLRLQDANRHITAQFGVTNSSSLAFKNSTAVFNGPYYNLTLEFLERTLVVYPEHSVSIGDARFQVAGIPVDDGLGRLRLYSRNDNTVAPISDGGSAIADISYGGTPLFVNGTVVYADANDSSLSVVIKNTGRPYIYMRAKDTEALLQLGALTNGTVAQSWIIARPDNVSLGALRLLKNSNRLKFNGTHLAVLKSDNDAATTEPVSVIALSAGIPLAEKNSCSSYQQPTRVPFAETTAANAAAEGTDTIEQVSSTDLTLHVGVDMPLSTADAAAERSSVENKSESTQETGSSLFATNPPSYLTSTYMVEVEESSLTSAVPLPVTTHVLPGSCERSIPASSVVPVLTADCVVQFLDKNQLLLSAVQLPQGCRLSVDQSGKISIEDDSGELAMSFENTQVDSVSLAGGVANLTNADGAILLNAQYSKDAFHVLDGQSLKVLRPDGSVALVLEHNSPFNISVHSGRIVAPPRPGGSGQLAVDLSLDSSSLKALINDTNVLLVDRHGNFKAKLLGVSRLNVDSGVLSVEKALVASPSSATESATPSQSPQSTTLASINLTDEGKLVPVFNGTHISVINPADGSVVAMVASPLSAAGDPDSVSGEALWAMLDNSPRWRLFVPGAATTIKSDEADNFTRGVIGFVYSSGETAPAELSFGYSEKLSPSDNREQPLLLASDEGNTSALLRVNASLIIVDGLHLEYRLGEGTVVARVDFVSANDSQKGSWYSSSNGTHVVIRSSDGEVLTMIGTKGTPSLSNDAAHLCQQSIRAADRTFAQPETSTAESIIRNESETPSSSLTTAKDAEDITEKIEYRSFVFAASPDGSEVIVCLSPATSVYTNESLDYLVIGNDAQGTRYVVAKPTVTASTTMSLSSAENLFTADPNVSIGVAPMQGPQPSQPPGPPLARPVLINDGGGSGTLVTRFAFIVMLTVCAMFLLGAVVMYVILHWTNREHDYILSSS